MRCSPSGILLACFVALSSSIYSFNLNDSIASETPQQWERVSNDIHACYLQEIGNDSLCFVVDRGDDREPMFLWLSRPQDHAALAFFIEECEKLIERLDQEKGQKRVGIVLSGTSAKAEVKAWLDKIAKQRKADPSGVLDIFGQPAMRSVKGNAPHFLLSYSFHLNPPKTYRDLRKLWVMELIQEMARDRLMKEGVLASHMVDAREFLLPSPTLRITIPYEDDHWQKSLQVTLQKMKEITDLGFTMDELNTARRDCLALIHELQKEKNEQSSVAFAVQGFRRGFTGLDYGSFLGSSASLLESVTPVDVAIVMHECFSNEQRMLSFVTPNNENHTWMAAAEQIIDLVEKGETQAITAALKTEIAPPVNLFEQLPLNNDERSMIHKIVDTIARDNVIKLGWKRKTMEKRGKKVRHVHPLRFLGYVFSDGHLRHCMREISRSSFKWNGFIDGMRPRIDEEAARGGLLPYVPGFARLLNVDEGRVRHYVEKHDWDGLVRYLL